MNAQQCHHAVMQHYKGMVLEMWMWLGVFLAAFVFGFVPLASSGLLTLLCGRKACAGELLQAVYLCETVEILQGPP